ncbi:TIGR04086 family membrane protein [Anaerobranca gottschalkii]|uniref:Putative membrane protein, TIGR04086 family n=1 Tax=Anaerobranca gottschalkii DSM 13577 TaxID=1120990 RepID=A0A1I0BI34_9FIRM|nr:TIGR04086 family membrane protein [Anaerobranca gottschalkii]SET06478.1 putative membrane protein, TIGR04086 family [Anaerobranca gottschalkii DSM 13577]
MAKFRRSRKKKNYKPEGNAGIKSYLFGVGTSILVTFVLLLVWALVLSVSTIPESSGEIFGIFTIILSVFSGGFVCAMKQGKNGWLSGGIVGLIYFFVVIIIISSIPSLSLSLFSLVNLLLSFIIGGIGGTLALNL